jgi:hypothetical protein
VLPPSPHPEEPQQQQPSSTTTTTTAVAAAGGGGPRRQLTPAQLVLLEASRVRRHEMSLKAMAAMERIAQSDRVEEESFRDIVIYGAPDGGGSSTAAAVDAKTAASNEQ